MNTYYYVGGAETPSPVEPSDELKKYLIESFKEFIAIRDRESKQFIEEHHLQQEPLTDEFIIKQMQVPLIASFISTFLQDVHTRVKTLTRLVNDEDRPTGILHPRRAPLYVYMKEIGLSTKDSTGQTLHEGQLIELIHQYIVDHIPSFREVSEQEHTYQLNMKDKPPEAYAHNETWLNAYVREKWPNVDIVTLLNKYKNGKEILKKLDTLDLESDRVLIEFAETYTPNLHGLMDLFISKKYLSMIDVLPETLQEDYTDSRHLLETHVKKIEVTNLLGTEKPIQEDDPKLTKNINDTKEKLTDDFLKSVLEWFNERIEVESEDQMEATSGATSEATYEGNPSVYTSSSYDTEPDRCHCYAPSTKNRCKRKKHANSPYCGQHINCKQPI